ncbi:hypothetical protein PFISCL1PPCAC_10829 [Pristionchus fissidentatus]|uniref:C2H2-type domain-containing protein n=1 Tax=Pristionchus fissidentatus TaxID=1538716 RepID=A0AAV5VLE8_9BILA|nr:hypothetical protein PFISCL1PPCAC_10829 [Pristionchus fissidentatus]
MEEESVAKDKLKKEVMQKADLSLLLASLPFVSPYLSALTPVINLMKTAISEPNQLDESLIELENEVRIMNGRFDASDVNGTLLANFIPSFIGFVRVMRNPAPRNALLAIESSKSTQGVNELRSEMTRLVSGFDNLRKELESHRLHEEGQSMDGMPVLEGNFYDEYKDTENRDENEEPPMKSMKLEMPNGGMEGVSIGINRIDGMGCDTTPQVKPPRFIERRITTTNDERGNNNDQGGLWSPLRPIQIPSLPSLQTPPLLSIQTPPPQPIQTAPTIQTGVTEETRPALLLPKAEEMRRYPKTTEMAMMINEELMKGSKTFVCPFKGCFDRCSLDQLAKHSRREHIDDGVLNVECSYCHSHVNLKNEHVCEKMNTDGREGETSRYLVKIEYKEDFDHDEATDRESYMKRLKTCAFCSYTSIGMNGPTIHMTKCVRCPHKKNECEEKYCISLKCGDCNEVMADVAEAVDHYSNHGHEKIKWTFSCNQK